METQNDSATGLRVSSDGACIDINYFKKSFCFCFDLLCFDSQAGASSRVDRPVVVDKPALSGAVRVLDRLSCQILAPAEPVNFL